MAGSSLRLARSPLAPKMTIAQGGAVGMLPRVRVARAPRPCEAGSIRTVEVVQARDSRARGRRFGRGAAARWIVWPPNWLRRPAANLAEKLTGSREANLANKAAAMTGTGASASMAAW